MRMLWALGPLADHDVQREILESRVQDFFDLTRQAVDLVDKEDVALLQVRQQGGQVAGLLDGGAGRDANLYAHLLRHDAGQRGLPRPGGP